MAPQININAYQIKFAVDVENDHGLLDDADNLVSIAAAVHKELKSMGRARVAAVHANTQSVAAGLSDEFCDDYHAACDAGVCALSGPKDLIINLIAM